MYFLELYEVYFSGWKITKASNILNYFKLLELSNTESVSLLLHDNPL